MLVLSRRPQERIVFPKLGIDVEILCVSGNTVRVGVNAPRDVLVLRHEVAEKDAARAAKGDAIAKPAIAMPTIATPAAGSAVRRSAKRSDRRVAKMDSRTSQSSEHGRIGIAGGPGTIGQRRNRGCRLETRNGDGTVDRAGSHVGQWTGSKRNCSANGGQCDSAEHSAAKGQHSTTEHCTGSREPANRISRRR